MVRMIEEIKKVLGSFKYKFNYGEIRSKTEESAKSSGYIFEHQILPIK